MGREKQTPRSKPSSQRRSAQANESKGQASERIFNLFLFVDGELITKLGGVCHEKSGSDRDKLSFLQANVNDDLPNAIDFSVPGRYQLATSSGLKPGLRYEGYMPSSPNWGSVSKSSRRSSPTSMAHRTRSATSADGRCASRKSGP